MSKQGLRRLATCWPILIAVGVTGCATNSPVDSACLWVKPIYSAPPDKNAPHKDDPGNVVDTPETQTAIEDHNSDFLCKCRKDCK